MRLRLLDVRPGERRNATGAFFALFGMLAGHSLLETARDTLFLTDIDANQLPFVYLGIAFVVVGLTQFQVRFQAKDGRRRVAMLAVVAAAGTALFWLLLDHAGTWILYALYVWSGIAATMLVVRFWTVTGDLFTVTQAKRLFPLIGSGSILGAIAGAAAAQQIVSVAPADMLLLAAALAFLATAMVPLILCLPPPDDRIRRIRTEETDIRDPIATLRAIAAHPYLKRVAALMIISTMTFTVADFIFKSAIARVASPDTLGWIFATVALVVNVASLIAQVVLVGWMTRRLAVDRVLAILPAMLLGVAAWIAAGGGAIAALLLRGVDGTFRHSLQRTANEVLYIPLSREWRLRAKGVIDVAGQRGGQALASIGLLLAGALGAPEPVLGGVLFLLCILWLLCAFGLKRPYFDVFRSTLDEGSIRTHIDFPDLDLASFETLIAALGSPDEAEVRAALDLLAEKDKLHLVPALILWHPSPSVVVRALELFRREGRSDHLRLVEKLLDHQDSSVRTAALLSFPPGEGDAERFEHALSDDAPDVRATALVGLLSSTENPHPRVQSILDTMIYAGSAEAKRQLARAIAARPSARFDGVLMSLTSHADPEVGREVAIAMRATPNPLYIGTLVGLLERRVSREEARRTLVAIGDEALEACVVALADESRPIGIRRHLPRTVSRFDPQAAARILVDRMVAEPDGSVRYKILRALGSVRSRDPSVKLDPKRLDAAIDRTLERMFEIVDRREAMLRHEREHPEWTTPVRALIVELLEHRQRLALERLFRLFSLRYQREDFRRIHRGVESGSRSAISSARELLENALPPARRHAVLGLLDDIDPARRLASGERYYRPREHDPSELMKTLLEEEDVALRCLVAYHVAEIGLKDLREDLRVLCDRATDALAESLRKSVEMLDDPGRERAFVVHLR